MSINEDYMVYLGVDGGGPGGHPGGVIFGGTPEIGGPGGSQGGGVPDPVFGGLACTCQNPL